MLLLKAAASDAALLLLSLGHGACGGQTGGNLVSIVDTPLQTGEGTCMGDDTMYTLVQATMQGTSGPGGSTR